MSSSKNTGVCFHVLFKTRYIQAVNFTFQHFLKFGVRILCKLLCVGLTDDNLAQPKLIGKYKGLGLSQNTKTERFGRQPEHSVFPVWVLTGFACYSARKSRLTHAVFRKCIYT